MRITARYSELNTHMYLYGAPKYELKRLMETKQFGVKVSVMRKPVKGTERYIDNVPTLGYHKITLTQQVAHGVLDIMLGSGRLTEKEILELGLMPIAKAVDKERHHAITHRLGQAT